MNILVIFAAEYIFIVSILIILAYTIYLWFKNRNNFFKFLALSLLSFPLSYLISRITELIIYDPRPFVVEHVKPLIAHAADNGFPSDHMLLTVTIAAVVFIYNRKLGALLTLIAICIGTARVLAKVHHVEDILGSIIIAIIATIIAFFINKRFRFDESDFFNFLHH